MSERLITRRNLLQLAIGGIAILVAPTCSAADKSEGSVKATKLSSPIIPTVDKKPEGGDPLKIKPLWSERGFREQAFGQIYKQLESKNYVGKSNLEAGRSIYLKDPNKKPFYNTPPEVFGSAYGEVLTFYREYQNPHLLWPLAQEYRTLGFMNVFLIGGYGDFPQEARTLKPGAEKIFAEANVIEGLVDGNKKFSGIKIEEVHYGTDGSPIFRCTSQFNANMVKVGEANLVGKKVEEYYFLWPARDK
ncbi:MAG: hypothetical protein UU73_C0003G0249 [Candidatus Daviesbacteria bacterium GW2011_GWA1_41_61]|uniref:Uncharacterized protein n=1 Tax=Candidatus Daviesbacteria bacterium GW2011_GWA2_40_9 TaxID=1618424 RepID=A0A0G0X819_9BACT|nr:MAG: hypothetical protein UU26_C0004G0033 [Candidatus Daviesbacteria bacterium GW2011_GWC1_40_9]KKR83792.1 MAG: hypothetical protein UU29_C0001G0012 [Candidatus Daviesbacteria bacterium GW2011_GWA2_40_9]KKR93401.1 MAG: hypothetical protein UU44_C0002G0062 [Candidatus Daviesbacteria bacterium GW2011_GWB1_41_15]KKS15050.1 MAG: hypothetical protein UU73_C0003G0249 [Candidatus Daviesbacteria bacterium GW2011_GWA1_41_61]